MHTRLRYRRDGQTDRQTAFQLYIVENNTGTRALPDIYTLALGHRAYISGKALLPVL